MSLTPRARLGHMLLKEAVNLWADARVGEGVARTTRRNELLTLTRFVLHAPGDALETVSPEDVASYFTMRRVLGIKPNTLNLELYNLRAFFKHAVAMGWIANGDNPVAYRKPMAVFEEERLRIPVEQFPDLLANAASPRDRMVLALGLYLFPRESEIRTLQWGDWSVDGERIVVQVHKSGRTDEMPVSLELRAELDHWWQQWSTRHGSLPQAGDPLVPAYTTAGEIRGPWVQPHHAVQTALARLGFPTTGEGCHTLRRSGARALFDRLSAKGYDHALRVVKEMLHHSSVTTTEKYLGVSGDRLERDDLIAGRWMYS